MILIDSYYINIGGGKVLLDYLINTLVKQNIKFNLIVDARNKKIIEKCQNNSCFICENMFKRNYLLNKLTYKNKYHSVFLFNNIPPIIKLKPKVFCYFQNVNLLDPGLKFYYLALFKNNVDEWIFQTNKTKEFFKKKIDFKKGHILPFFDEFEKCKNNFTNKNFFYPTSDHPHKNNNILLKVFKEISQTNPDLKLFITLSAKNREDFMIPNITFLDQISKEKVSEMINKCNYIIHPSIKESFGLVLIEAANKNKIVIASALPYVTEVIEPSLTFKPDSKKSIFDAIIATQNKNIKSSKLKVKNKINQLIKLISNEI